MKTDQLIALIEQLIPFRVQLVHLSICQIKLPQTRAILTRNMKLKWELITSTLFPLGNVCQEGTSSTI